MSTQRVPLNALKDSPEDIQRSVQQAVNENKLCVRDYLWLLVSGVEPPPLFGQNHEEKAEAVLDECVELERSKRSPTHCGWQQLREGFVRGTSLPGVLVDIVMEYHCPSTSPLLLMLARMHVEGRLPERDSAELKKQLKNRRLAILPSSFDVVLMRRGPQKRREAEPVADTVLAEHQHVKKAK